LLNGEVLSLGAFFVVWLLPVEALMAVYGVLKLMLEIKRHDYFKDMGRAKLN